MDAPPEQAADLHGADVRDAIAILLALAAGAVDAISFLGLGGAFSANMTGNVVLLGAAADHGFGEALLRSGAALAGYVVGVYVAARAVRAVGGERMAPGELWPGWMTAGLAAVAAVECLVLAGWLASGGRPGLGAEAILLGTFALAMGAQGAFVHRLGLSGVTTTYVTGTLTGFLSELATASGSGRNRLQRLSMVLALFVGAAAAALLVLHARQAAALLPPLLTGAAIVLAVRGFGRRPAGASA
ncbi:MAG: YoaK family protein [Solirubrobacterales bacterium]